ncbi:Stf0 family sulfotransferase [Acuticoccus mangrovi]|uniref:Sulphotransferase Stf0 domain-containing protein n=1 Tax=Acuticoccus mangrovi TaxID=2796142 RepID=A0A934IM12_9HYPH|nr:Stf0 family sulfotransferase [Acuticoccus mangrovi]MBJ3774390.1 hypothetical protein [Acuticoccus mangrovi]
MALTLYEHKILQRSNEWFDKYLAPEKTGPVSESDGPLLLLCMTPRSGSSALSAALTSTGKLGRGGERLNRKDGGPLEEALLSSPCGTRRQVLDMVIAGSRTPNGVAQIKCDLAQIYPFLADAESFERLKTATWVYLTRQDILGQAISRYRGFKTGFWHSTGGKKTESPDAGYDFEEIRRQVVFITDMMASFERTFASIGVQPLRISYEELTANEGGTLKKIADAMGIEIDNDLTLEASGYSKVASSNTDELRDRFLADFKSALVAGG